MGVVQRALNDQVNKVPEMALRKVLARKLEEVGVTMPPEGVEAFARHLLDGKKENFIWDDGKDSEHKSHSLSFDDDDFDDIRRMVDSLTESLPELIDSVSKKSAVDLFKTLQANWEIEGAVQAFEINEFRERMEKRWGEGLDLLRMLLTVCREIGRDAVKRYSRSKSKQHRFRRFVLVRLHSRACQVADEIITLMENGFADGAMARWRTLHEIAVVTTLIENGDEAFAERYILHDAVDLMREADEYDRTQVPLGYAPISAAARKEIERDYAGALKRFGDDFKNDYGWAAPLMKGKPTFKRLQDEAGRVGMTSYYKLASYTIHVGARSMFHRLADNGEGNLLLAGRSNAGLVEPGQNLAFTLVQITAALTPTPNDIDKIIQHLAVVEIRDAIPKALLKADRKLRKDEAAFQKSRLAKESARMKRKRSKSGKPA